MNQGYPDQSVTGLQDKFAAFKGRLNDHLDDNQNLDIANNQGEMPPWEEAPLSSLAELKKSPTPRKPETASVGARHKIENRLGSRQTMLEDQHEETKSGGGPSHLSGHSRQQPPNRGRQPPQSQKEDGEDPSDVKNQILRELENL